MQCINDLSMQVEAPPMSALISLRGPRPSDPPARTLPSIRIAVVNSSIRRPQSDGHTNGRQQRLIHQMKTATLFMDNRDYPRMLRNIYSTNMIRRMRPFKAVNGPTVY